MPNVTHAQVLSVVTFIVSQVVAWGWLSNDAGQRLISVGGIVVAAVWQIADAYLRAQRAHALASTGALNVTTPSKAA